LAVPIVVSIAVGITLEIPTAILPAWNSTSSVKPETKSKPPGRDGSACYRIDHACKLTTAMTKHSSAPTCAITLHPSNQIQELAFGLDRRLLLHHHGVGLLIGSPPDACDRAVSERRLAGEKELEALGKTTAVSVCDLSDPWAQASLGSRESG
jgi:hypothetical protein